MVLSFRKNITEPDHPGSAFRRGFSDGESGRPIDSRYLPKGYFSFTLKKKNWQYFRGYKAGQDRLKDKVKGNSQV